MDLTAISSKATARVLLRMAIGCQERLGIHLHLESVGGVDAAKRVRAGEAFDLVFLARDALDALIHDGAVLADSATDLMLSKVAVAVRTGEPPPDLSSEASLRHAVETASSIGYSTGPSGTALAALFARWGLSDVVATKLKVPPPGVAVADWVASGVVALGFQQTSEMLHVTGIDVVGPLPPPVAITTVFSAAIATTCPPERRPFAAAYLAEMRQAWTLPLLAQEGMQSSAT